jgi:hypothetical protein
VRPCCGSILRAFRFREDGLRFGISIHAQGVISSNSKPAGALTCRSVVTSLPMPGPTQKDWCWEIAKSLATVNWIRGPVPNRYVVTVIRVQSEESVTPLDSRR